MLNELDASNIIAAIAGNNQDADNLMLYYSDIRNVAKRLEKDKPTLLTSYDLISIDAFRCQFVPNVEMNNYYLTIKDLPAIKFSLRKLMPSKEITELIVRFANESICHETHT